MKRAGLAIPQGYEITGDFEFWRRLLTLHAGVTAYQRPQAVLPGNERDGCRRLIRRYIRRASGIPQDMAVIGYDDIELALAA